MSVQQYVSLLKANKYPKYELLPPLKAADIDVLIKHAADEQLIDNYPIPALSAADHGPQQVGMIILYTIESIRLQKPQGASSRPYIADKDNPQRRPALKEVAGYYVAWWDKHKGNNTAELKNAAPLAGTSFSW